MIRISRLFKNIFVDSEISVAELLAFTADHQGRLVANNPTDPNGGGFFDAIISELATAFATAGGTVTNESVAIAIRQARVAAKNTLLNTIRDMLSRREGQIRDVFGKGSPAYIEFYPAGLTEYARMVEAEVPEKLGRYLAACSTHGRAALGVEVSGFLSQWTAISGQVQAQKGAVANTNDVQEAAQKTLCDQLMKNVLTIALHFMGQEEKAGVYFNQSLLEDPESATQPPVPPPPAPTA